MLRSHKIALDPNHQQATYFAKACGVAQFAYNWGLAQWKRQYEAGENPSASLASSATERHQARTVPLDARSHQKRATNGIDPPW